MQRHRGVAGSGKELLEPDSGGGEGRSLKSKGQAGRLRSWATGRLEMPGSEACLFGGQIFAAVFPLRWLSGWAARFNECK